ncbi:uncharacterized protein PV09_01035 [Verruconis gallopava]|uniref:Probable alpha/beta-glucosidase agdC n=1 Tax=Verruconis gallopava TaxID=253628 RepID=A0A0D1Z553_9PEZI|nr:uncharacterized protein PV09_01035 [Verruconis gallopava]KIW08097.1 hypothetical protein PV09_01035 [Verruconis gallopava]
MLCVSFGVDCPNRRPGGSAVSHLAIRNVRNAVDARGLISRQAAIAACPGYRATNVVETETGLAADLELAGTACDVYGKDIERLRLLVNFDDANRVHVKIEDSDRIAYQVPESVFPRPSTAGSVPANQSQLEFTLHEDPFSFTVKRRGTGDVLFDSSAAPLIFSDQYVRLRTYLPDKPNLYGLGEHSDSLRLGTTNYTRTFWARDAYGIPSGTNLYGTHPVYYDHRGKKGTHGVFMLSSSGMDVKIDGTRSAGHYLEYNMLGGVVDLYLFAGPTPLEASQQYSDIVGRPALMPYWSLGLHQCRYGYRDYIALAEVISNYSAAGIPLETMWVDIDYMFNRFIMTTDPDRFPMERMREIVSYLHDHDQHFIVMVDPAVAYQTEREAGLEYKTFTRARDEGLFLSKNGSIFKGVVWPGVTAFPDWFNPSTSQYWIDQFAEFFDPQSGIDIDGLWIDMNEAANFNSFGDDPEQAAVDRGFPPPRAPLRSPPRALPGFPAAFQPNDCSPFPPDDQGYSPPWLAGDAAPNAKRGVSRITQWFSMIFNWRAGAADARKSGSEPPISESGAPVKGYRGRNLLEPAYRIKNENNITAFGGLSNFTIDTDVVHYDGHVELDVHNLYGSMMSRISRTAMEARRPERRPFIVTRSTFAGDGRNVAKWLGDNLSTWEHYRQSIQGMLNFATFFQMPMVGSDVCGFGGNATEALCARWATLGAFYPFMRNHNGDTSLPQEFYISETVASAARSALDMRYRLLDYMYTCIYKQNQTGAPVLSPLFYKYPFDDDVFGIELQFFCGDHLLISPVTEENSTSVEMYLPDDLFYDFVTYKQIRGQGTKITLKDVALDQIPVHVKAGAIIPMRNSSAMTTRSLRQRDFHILIAPDAAGKASGDLYLDDGDSVEQAGISMIEFTWSDGTLTAVGSFAYKPAAERESRTICRITILGISSAPAAARLEKSGNGEVGIQTIYSSDSQSLELNFADGVELDASFKVVTLMA